MATTGAKDDIPDQVTTTIDVDKHKVQTLVDYSCGVDALIPTAVSSDTLPCAAHDNKPLLEVQHMDDLKSSITLKNAVERFIFGQQRGLPELVDEVVKFVERNFAEFASNGGLIEVVKKAPDPKLHGEFLVKLVDAITARHSKTTLDEELQSVEGTSSTESEDGPELNCRREQKNEKLEDLDDVSRATAGINE